MKKGKIKTMTNGDDDTVTAEVSAEVTDEGKGCGGGGGSFSLFCSFLSPYLSLLSLQP